MVRYGKNVESDKLDKMPDGDNLTIVCNRVDAYMSKLTINEMLYWLNEQ